MGIEKKVVSIRLDATLVEGLRECAKDENRPLSNFIETVLKDYMEENRLDDYKDT